MPVMHSIKRLFISYSRSDQDIVHRLARDLRQHGVEVWLDFEGVTPGTSDWEAAIRSAIEASFAFLIIATPASRKSPYVRSELLLAESRKLPIFAVWAAGQDWIDSIPLSLAHVQYPDLRGENYDSGFKELREEMNRRRMTLPRHFLYKQFYRRIDDVGKLAPDDTVLMSNSDGLMCGKLLPSDFATIAFADAVSLLDKPDCCDAIAVRPSDFVSAHEMIDEIYREYLTDRYPPLTYGEDWVLEQDIPGILGTRIVLPWSFIKSSKPVGGWQTKLAEPPRFHGLIPSAEWVISDKRPEHLRLYAADDGDALWALLLDLKLHIAADEEDLIEEVPPHSLEPELRASRFS
jgi:hypothetical protein